MPIAREPQDPQEYGFNMVAYKVYQNPGSRESFWQSYEKVIASYAENLAYELAMEYGFTSETIETDTGELLPSPSREDRAKALRYGIPPAVLFTELCRSEMISIPELVRLAMEGCDDLPWVIEERFPGWPASDTPIKPPPAA